MLRLALTLAPPSLHRARVEGVLLAVTEEVEGNNGSEDREAGPDSQRRGVPDRLLRVGRHVTPAVMSQEVVHSVRP